MLSKRDMSISLPEVHEHLCFETNTMAHGRAAVKTGRGASGEQGPGKRETALGRSSRQVALAE